MALLFQEINFFCTYTYIHQLCQRGLELADCIPLSRVFANDLGDRGSIPGRVIPKTQKMAVDPALLNTQHYKVVIKGKVGQSWEWSSALPYISV